MQGLSRARLFFKRGFMNLDVVLARKAANQSQLNISHADAMALYARAEIAVVPSLWQEPFGRSAIEALASGCALIAAPVGGLAEVAAGAGEIVDASDVPALSAAMRRVATDAALRARLQQAGRAKALAAYDIARVTSVLDAARARLLAEP